MKIKHTICLTLLALIIASTALAQKPACKSLHVGSFKVSTKESGTTLIKRTEKHQIEKNDDLGYEVIFDITWIDECIYELRPKLLIKGDPSIMGDGTFVLKTKIKEISDNGYVAETSANFSPGVFDFVVEIIK
jgi:hypothetical protein